MSHSSGRVDRASSSADVNKFDKGLMDKAQKSIDRHQAEDEHARVQTEEASDDKVQKVDGVEFYVPSNAVEHHTTDYEFIKLDPPVPVYRRGQTFYLAIRFTGTRAFDANNDVLKLIFTFGPKPNTARGTQADIRVKFDVINIQNKDQWEAVVQHHEGTILSLHVNIPALAPVGIWKCNIVTGIKQLKKRRIHECKNDIYILFNPWCKDDRVYMEDDNWRKETVLNDVGKIYMGVHKAPTGRSWLFGQFDDVILPACLLLLDRAKVDFDFRGDPIRVIRGISAVVNSRDDDGLLVDNWSGDYTGGTSPMGWTGSLKIFEEFIQSGGKSVKYGQCWVFSGCVTTFCRALGIPCRSITNYVSAHDCHQNLCVDKFYNSQGEPITYDDEDAIWNFHVWNEVWMARNDLPSGYGGWQIVDATPQEQSEGSYRLGPASLMAVRKGEIGLQYDTMFVISEVNADIIHWQEDEEAENGLRQMKSNNYYIGKKILTKAPDKYKDDNSVDDALNVIDYYKNPEGSKEERLQLFNAARNARLFHLYNAPDSLAEDVKFDLLDIDKIMIGQPFKVTVTIQNTSNQQRSIFLVLNATSVFYTGVVHESLKKSRKEFVLAPQQNETISLNVKPEEYVSKMVDYAMIKICATASVQETHQAWAEEDDFEVEKPPLKVEFLSSPIVNKPLPLKWSFQNPLPYSLENCKFVLEGAGLSRPKTIEFRDVGAKEKVIYEETVLPQRPGECKIVTTFNSKQLKELNASATIVINAN